jgi:hypothetical protein
MQITAPTGFDVLTGKRYVVGSASDAPRDAAKPAARATSTGSTPKSADKKRPRSEAGAGASAAEEPKWKSLHWQKRVFSEAWLALLQLPMTEVCCLASPRLSSPLLPVVVFVSVSAAIAVAAASSPLSSAACPCVCVCDYDGASPPCRRDRPLRGVVVCSQATYKDVLTVLPKDVIPVLVNPLLLSDFLTDSFKIGMSRECNCAVRRALGTTGASGACVCVCGRQAAWCRCSHLTASGT